jgi:hypothetical protein
MAIVKIDAGLATSPSLFAQPVLNQIASLLNSYNKSAIIKDGYVLKGSLFCIGGSMYIANSDTAISGTASAYVAITASGDTATAAYTANINSAAWNGSYHNYYDAAEVLYLFDESDAINDGLITTRYYVPTPTGEPNHFTLGDNRITDSEVSGNNYNNSYAEVCHYYILRSGKIRVNYTIKGTAPNDLTGTAYGKLYINGSPVSDYHSMGLASSNTYVEDYTISAGDRISIYTGSTNTSYYAHGIINYLSCGFII